jgi:hypothetical protein
MDIRNHLVKCCKKFVKAAMLRYKMNRLSWAKFGLNAVMHYNAESKFTIEDLETVTRPKIV